MLLSPGDFLDLALRMKRIISLSSGLSPNSALSGLCQTSSRVESCAEVGILKRCCQCCFITALLPTRVVVGVPSGALKKGSVPAPRAFPKPPRSLLTISQYCPGCAPGCRPSKCFRRGLSFAGLTSFWTSHRAFEYFRAAAFLSGPASAEFHATSLLCLFSIKGMRRAVARVNHVCTGCAAATRVSAEIASAAFAFSKTGLSVSVVSVGACSGVDVEASVCVCVLLCGCGAFVCVCLCGCGACVAKCASFSAASKLLRKRPGKHV